MSHVALTARYRPQTFAEVAGQETIKAILSRAALEGKVAPAYLLSGTRGVGKTTIARIFAKALNCAHAPTDEPCNTCEQCRQITQGIHVDVVEIDGASNRGIDDARRLKEAIGYAPMEGRYKVFIIDEAHMLTKEAFNALLKTLEEPPARVTFILATTESHKFPITIVSRCQHFTFTRLSEAELEAHLSNILAKEHIEFEAAAVKLIAKRAAGSVRDSMSLLGQVLALGEENLSANAVRGVLGLAGQEAFFRIMEALAAQDCLAVATIVRELLDQGVDIGFFLRELVATWRTLFMLRQAGEAALPLLDLSADEGATWLAWAKRFDTSLIHACWQMTLEGQRRVLTSLEPAMALELLLLNIAMLPRLMPLESLQTVGNTAPLNPIKGSSPRPVAMPERVAPAVAPSPISGPAVKQDTPNTKQNRNQVEPAHIAQAPSVPWTTSAATSAPATPPQASPTCTPRQQPPKSAEKPVAQKAFTVAPLPNTEASASSFPSENPTWEGFLVLCQAEKGQAKRLATSMRQAQGQFSEGILTLATMASVQYERLSEGTALQCITTLAKSYFGEATRVDILPPQRIRRTEAENREAVEGHPAVQLLKQEMGARFLKCTPLDSLI